MTKELTRSAAEIYQDHRRTARRWLIENYGCSEADFKLGLLPENDDRSDLDIFADGLAMASVVSILAKETGSNINPTTILSGYVETNLFRDCMDLRLKQWMEAEDAETDEAFARLLESCA